MTEYALTEHGVQIRERYSWTLISAQEAVDLMWWLNWHCVELEAMRRKRLEEQKAKEQKKEQAS